MNLALVTDQAAEADSLELMPMLAGIGRRARAAQRVVGLATAEQKTAALRSLAASIRAAKDDILLANATDLVTRRRKRCGSDNGSSRPSKIRVDGIDRL